jgi:hypothetical protein
MTKNFVPTLVTIRPLPYTGGESTRFKAEPTRLTPLAGKIMMASGALSTRRHAVSLPMGRIFGAMALLGLSAAFFLIDGQHSNTAQTQAAIHAPADAQLLSVGLFENAEPIAREQPAALERYAPGAGAEIDSQDQFEIARFIRLSAVVQPPRQKAEQVRRIRPANTPAS